MYILLNGFAAVLLFSGAAYVLRRENVSWVRISAYALLMITAFFMGSRLLYGLLYLDKIIENPLKLIELRLVNFSLYGGLIFCGLLWWYLMKREALNFWRVTDRLVPILGLAVAISKMGCFANGCCYGVPTNLPWGVVFERADQTPVTRLFGGGAFTRMISGATVVHRHPTQLYEGFFALLAAVISMWLIYRLKKSNGGRDASDYSNGLPAIFFILILTGGRLLSFILRDFPNASASSNLLRGPLIYGMLIIGFSFIYMFRFQSQKPHV